MQEELGDLPATVVEPACCPEFMVTRERVRRRPLSFYKTALDILHVSVWRMPVRCISCARYCVADTPHVGMDLHVG